MNPATVLAFDRSRKVTEKMKKCEPNLCLLKETGRMAVNRMKIVNSSATEEQIRTHMDGIPASEIERKLRIEDPWHLAMTSFYDYPKVADTRHPGCFVIASSTNNLSGSIGFGVFRLRRFPPYF